jgi:hypothetical protein
MAKSVEEKPGPFATLFAWVGSIAGGAGGLEVGGGLGMLIGAIVFAVIGVQIGRLADAVVARLVFITASIIALIINTAVRRFLLELILAAAN